MDSEEVKKALVTPFHTVQIEEYFSEPHETLISEEEWVQANSKLIEEIGAEAWLRLLLDALRKK
jgi:hypothetical protein